MRTIHLALSCLLCAGILLFTPGSNAAPSTVEHWVSTLDSEAKLQSGPALTWEKSLASVDRVVTVDPKQRFQSILGLGSSLEHATCYNISKLPEVEQDQVIDHIVNPETGMGMNLMRICIGTSDFAPQPYYSYTEVPAGEEDFELKTFSIDRDKDYLIPIIKKAFKANPELLFVASPWSPPAWMKSNGSMNAGRLRPECQEAYAQYLVKFIQAYEAEGIPIHAITVQNEPKMIHKGYPTCLWQAEEQRDFIKKHLGPQLEQAGLDTEIWCWDHNWNRVDFPRTILEDPEAAQYVDGTAFHLYEGTVDAQSILQEEFPDKPIYFTEGSVFAPRGALELINILRHWARGYNAWVTVLDNQQQPNSGPHHAIPTCIELQPDGSLQYGYDFYMYGHFMKFIQRGTVRIHTPESEKMFGSIAFQNPDGSTVLVVSNSSFAENSFAVQLGEHHFEYTIAGRSVATYRWTNN